MLAGAGAVAAQFSGSRRHVAEPVRESQSSRGDREGLGVVHGISGLDDHQVRSVVSPHCWEMKDYGAFSKL